MVHLFEFKMNIAVELVDIANIVLEIHYTLLNYYSVSVMFNKDYVLDEIRKSEQFADDQKYILDYCMRVRLENKERKERNDKQIPDVSGRQC